jgi:hypothetical protein
MTTYASAHPYAAPLPYNGSTAPPTPPAPEPGIFNGEATFFCPTIEDVPQYDVDASQRQVMLMRHFRPHVRGINVCQRSDATFCQDTAAVLESQLTNPAPWVSDFPVGPDATNAASNAQWGYGLLDTNVNYPWNIANDTPQDLDYIQPAFQAPNDPKYPFSYVTQWNGEIVQSFSNPFLVKWWEGGAQYQITQALALVLTEGGYGDCVGSAP